MLFDATILVADDEHTNHELIGARLSALSFGGRIVSVYDGAEALDWMAAEPCPLMLFLDLNMPRMTGREVLARLDAGEVGPPPPVCIISSSERAEDISLSHRYGFVVGYLDKPPSAAELFRATSADVSTRSHFSAPV